MIAQVVREEERLWVKVAGELLKSTQPDDAVEKTLRDAQKKLHDTECKLEDTEEKLLQTSSQLSEAEKDLKSAKIAVADKEIQIEEVKISLADLQKRLNVSTSKIEKQKCKLKRLRVLVKKPSIEEANALREIVILKTREHDDMEKKLKDMKTRWTETSNALVQEKVRVKQLEDKLEKKRYLYRKVNQNLQRMRRSRLVLKPIVNAPADKTGRKKRVPVSMLKNKAQAKKRREDYVNAVVDAAKNRAQAELIDDVKGLRISFAEMDFDVKFTDDFADDDQPMTFEMEEENEKKAMQLVDKLICLYDHKCSSMKAIQEQKKVDTSDVSIEIVKQRRNALNDELAAELDLKYNSKSVDVDVRKTVERIVKTRHKLTGLNKLSVFFAADGRSIKHSHHSLGCYIAILEEGNDIHKHDHLYPIGLYRCPEKHKDFKPYADRIVQGLQSIQDNGIFDGKVVCNVYLGGDYKWLALVLGLWAASSKKQCCAHCLITWSARKSNPTSYKIVRGAKRYKKKGACKHEPIVGFVPAERVITDPLHMLLRILGKLLDLTMREIFKHHNKDKAALEQITTAMRRVFPSFHFFVHAEARSGKAWNAKYGFRPFRGNEYLTLLHQFDKIAEPMYVHDPPRGRWILKIWNSFGTIYRSINCDAPEDETMDEREARAQALQKAIRVWIADLNHPASCVQDDQDAKGVYKAGGFGAAETSTVYMHELLCHAHEFVSLYGGIRKFTMQNVEYANNDDGRALASTNSQRSDTCVAELMLRRLRMVFSEHGLANQKTKTEECKICNDRVTSKGYLRRHYKQRHKLKTDEDILRVDRDHARTPPTIRTITHTHTNTSSSHTFAVFSDAILIVLCVSVCFIACFFLFFSASLKELLHPKPKRKYKPRKKKLKEVKRKVTGGQAPALKKRASWRKSNIRETGMEM